MTDPRGIFEAWLDRNYPAWQHDFDVEELMGRIWNEYQAEECHPEFDFSARKIEEGRVLQALKRPQLSLF